jgi:tetratricopeptide (TPR) repeat protein
VATSDRVRRQQILREAEGYLELIGLFGESWTPPLAARSRLSNQALAALDRLSGAYATGSQAQLLRGLALRAAERYDDAVEPLRKAAEADSECLDAWLALGWCYKRTGRLPQAIDALEQAMAADPAQAIVHYNLACYWSLAGRTNQALHFLAQAFSMDSNYRSMAEREPDFDPIRNDPGFQGLFTIIV